jgi:hypothetical protein
MVCLSKKVEKVKKVTGVDVNVKVKTDYGRSKKPGGLATAGLY